MKPDNRILRFSDIKIQQLKQETKKDEKTIEKLGDTKQIPVSADEINQIMEEITSAVDDNEKNAAKQKAPVNNLNAMDDVTRDTDNKTSKYDDNAIWDKSTNIKDFITETLKGAGFDIDDNPDIVNQLFLAIIRDIVDKKVDIPTTINSVTQLISLSLTSENSLDTSHLIQELIQVLLVQKNVQSSRVTNKDVKEVILKELQRIIDANQIYPVDPEPVEPNPVELTPAEQAMLNLTNAIDNATVDENQTIKEFLLQFKDQASEYIQQEFGYDKPFANILSMFFATAVNDTSGVKSGLMKDANLSAIKEKFLAFIQDMSFLDTTNGVSAYDKSAKIGAFNIEYLIASDHRTENGYRIGYVPGKTDHTYDNNITYNPDNSLNGAVFIKFMVEHLKDNVYGGKMNAEQMKLIMTEVIKEFGKGGYAAYYPFYKTNIKLGDANVRNGVDRNKDGSCLDDLFNAMMKVAADVIKPMDVNDLTSAEADSFISNLFGNKSGLTASDIFNNEANYLVSNDLGVRGIIQALVDITEQYNIHNENDYKEFLNVFIKMIYEKCGESVSGTPKLTKSILQKYFAQGNTVQDLKELIESKELRNAYYMEYILEDGGIDNELDQYGFYQKVDGDCWLVACLHALNESDAGKLIISGAITDNKDNSWTVRLYDTTKKPAEPKYYKITLNELMEAFGTGWYGGGDPTLMLIELATSRLRKDINTWNSYKQDPTGDPYLWGGFQNEMMKYLIGTSENQKKWSYVTNNVAQQIKNWALEQLNNGNIQSGGVGNYMIYLSIGGHAYAVTGITEDGVTYIDPFHPEDKKFKTWAELVGCADFGYVELPSNSN